MGGIGEIMINRYDPHHFTLICELFSACNLHCKFCFKNTENPDLDINYDYIAKTLPEDIRRELLPEFVERKVNTLLFNIFGGEILMDELSDEFFDSYRELRKSVGDMIQEVLPDCTIYCNISSNAIFKKKERVLKLLEDLDAKINISYDPHGRYASQDQFDQVKENVEFFRQAQRLNLIVLTPTRPTIQTLMANPSKYIDWLPKDIVLDLSYYLPMNNDNDILAPSDDELAIFFKWCIDNRLFNVSEINGFFVEYIDPSREIHSYCHDARIATKVGDKSLFSHCCHGMITNFYLKGEEEYYGENYKLLKEAKEDKRLIGRRLRNCLLCEYEDRCPGMCFSTVMWHGSKLSKCPIKVAFEYISEHPEIVEEFKKSNAGELKR